MTLLVVLALALLLVVALVVALLRLVSTLWLDDEPTRARRVSR